MPLYICSNPEHVQDQEESLMYRLCALSDNDVAIQSVNCNKCTAPAGDTGNGEGCTCVGRGVWALSLHFLLNFALNLNCSLKKYKLKKVIKFPGPHTRPTESDRILERGYNARNTNFSKFA